MVIKSAFLALSTNSFMQKFVSKSFLTKKMARRFAAGDEMKDGIVAAKKLNKEGFLVTLDHLGENVKTKSGVRVAVNHYTNLLNQMAKAGIRAGISVKLTQIGLDIDKEYCVKNLKTIAEKAKKHKLLVELDMESSDYTADTIEIYTRFRKKKYKMAVALQAYLYRSHNDAKNLAKLGSIVRIVKGAYKEDDSIAIQEKALVDDSYTKLLSIFMTSENMKKNVILIGTHDQKMIDEALHIIEGRDIPRNRIVFQMLYGIRRDIQKNLIAKGYYVSIYLPYGDQWYPYFMRRLAERPANAFFLLKNLFR